MAWAENPRLQRRGRVRGPLIRGSSDENNRNAVPTFGQMTLKLQTAHPRQLHVENKARYFLQTTGFQKFLRGTEEFNRKVQRSHKSSCGFPKGIIIVYDGK